MSDLILTIVTYSMTAISQPTTNCDLNDCKNRAARLVTGTLLRTPTDKLTKELGWESLECRRKISKIAFFHNLLNNPSVPQFIRSIIPESRENDLNRTLRNSERITVPRHKTLNFKRSFIPSTIELWNILPLNLRNITSKKKFKGEVKSIYGTPTPPLYYSLGRKKENSLLTRLRVGMSKLNSPQFQIQANETPHCMCGHTKEDTPHFLLHCPLLHITRATMFRNIQVDTNINLSHRDNSAKLEILLHGTGLSDGGAEKVASSVFKFILDSKRF